MGSRALVPFVHAMPEVTDEAPWRIAALARDFPDIRMVVLDAFATYEQTQRVMFLADRAPNLLFDTSLMCTFDTVLPFVRRFGAERLVYGSDLYSHPLGYRRTHGIGQIIEADLSEEERTLIFSGNIRRLLGLADPQVHPAAGERQRREPSASTGA